MQSINIFGKEFTTIASMKAFAVEQGMDVKGSSKWVKAQWIAAVSTFVEAQNTAKEAAIVVANEVLETAVEAESAAVIVQDSIEEIVVHVVTVLTSPAAISTYRTALKVLLMAVVFALFIFGKTALWCWERRSDTAVYHWIKSAANSRLGWRLRIQTLEFLVKCDLAIGDTREMIERKISAAGSAMGLHSSETDPSL